MKPAIHTLIMLMFTVCPAVAQVVNPQTERPSRTMDQEIKEALIPAYRQIHQAQLEAPQIIFDGYEQAGKLHPAELTADGTIDTVSFNVTMQKPSLEVPWLYTDFTTNMYDRTTAGRVDYRNLSKRWNQHTEEWWVSDIINQISPTTPCDPFCSDYQRRVFNANGQVQSGFRTLRMPDYTDSFNWSVSEQDFIPSTRSIGTQDEQGRTLTSWMLFYNWESLSFRPGRYTEYVYDEFHRTIDEINLNFSPDSLYTSGTRRIMNYNSDHLPTLQLNQEMPAGHPDTTSWVNQQRTTFDYGSARLEQRVELWDAVTEEWTNYIKGYSYYTNMHYPDSSITYLWNAQTEEFRAIAKLIREYDTQNNLKLELTFMSTAEGLANTGRTEYTYNEDGKLVHQVIYGGTGGELFKTTERRYEYNDNGNQVFAENLGFSTTGVLSTGTRDYLVYEGTNYLGYYRYSYNQVEESWSLHTYFFSGRPTGERVVERQTMTTSWSGPSFIRTAFVSENKPVVFNDGPVFMAAGDTIRFTIEGIDTRLQTPAISITGLPEGAQFNPETREFVWVVPEVVPTSMMVRGETSLGSFETEVFFIDPATITSAEVNAEIPNRITLSQNYPNPFNPLTNIAFELDYPSQVTVEVFDVTGRLVGIAARGMYAAGRHVVSFDGRSLASGVYIYRLRTPEYVSSAMKMTLIK